MSVVSLAQTPDMRPDPSTAALEGRVSHQQGAAFRAERTRQPRAQATRHECSLGRQEAPAHLARGCPSTGVRAAVCVSGCLRAGRPLPRGRRR
jgi:hypothetical protein